MMAPFDFLACKETATSQEQKISIKTDSVLLLLKEIDTRPWKVVSNKYNKNCHLKEYLLTDETAENWSEQVSVGYFFQNKGSLDDFYKAFLSGIKDKTAKASLNTRLLHKAPNALFFEWWTENQTPQKTDANNVHEWVELVQNGTTFSIFRYTTKKLDAINTLRPTWEKAIGSTLRNARFQYQTPEFRIEIPNTWEADEITAQKKGLGEFLASPGLTTIISIANFMVSPNDKQQLQNELQVVKSIFQIRNPLETIADLNLNDGIVAQLYQFKATQEDLNKDLQVYKLIAKIRQENRLVYLYGLIKGSDSYLEKKAEFLSIVKTFEFLPTITNTTTTHTTSGK